MESSPVSGTSGLLGEAITRYLIRHQLPAGTLYDEWDSAPTADGHYANAFFALALVRLFRLNGDDRILHSLLKVLDYLIRVPDSRKGHREFNQYAFLRVWTELSEGAELPTEIHASLKRRLNPLILPRFDSGRYTVHGNNWVTLKAVDYLLLGHIRGSRSYRYRGQKLIRRCTLNWQDTDGVFADFPRDPRSRFQERLTPLTYHAAACFVLLEALPFMGDPLVRQALMRGVNVLSFWVDDDGKFAPYGRSNCSLFGLATAANTLLRAGRELEPSGRTEASERALEWEAAGLRAANHIRRLQLPDGSVLLNPGSKGQDKSSWDFYMHHTVYNAFAAALLLDPSIRRPERIRSEPASVSRKGSRTFFFLKAGLVVSDSGSGRAVLSLQGQQSLPEFELDPRFSGMNLISLRSEGCDIIPPPPVPPSADGNLISPGFVPCLHAGGREYHPYTWSRIRIQAVDDRVLMIQGYAGFRTRNPWRRFQRTLHRWLRKPALRKAHFEEIARMLRPGPFLYRLARISGPALPQLKRTIIILANPFTVVFRDRIENRTPHPVSWHPFVLRLFPDWRHRDSEIVWGNAGRGGRIRFEGLEPGWCRLVTGATALGPCRILYSIPAEVRPGETQDKVYSVSPLGEPVIHWERADDGLILEGEAQGAGEKRFFRFPVPA